MFVKYSFSNSKMVTHIKKTFFTPILYVLDEITMFEMALGEVVLNFKLDLLFVVHTHALRAN